MVTSTGKPPVQLNYWGENMIYLDNAATSGKKPQEVINAVAHSLRYLNANPGRGGNDMAIKTAMSVYSVRKKIKEMFNAKSENNVCFTLNCTMAINMILYGVLNRGDHVIISSLEHNAVSRPINYLKEYKGIEYDIANVDMLHREKTVENFKKLIKKNTKMIFCTHASNVTGYILPITEIGLLSKEREILFGVDAAQSAGVIDIDMQKMNIDFLAIAPHKGLFAPMGTGVLIAEKPIKNILISGGTGTNSLELFQPDEPPERLESGTVNLPGIVGIGEGINFIKSKGIKRVHKYEIELLRTAYFGIEKIGGKLYTPPPTTEDYTAVLSFNVKDMSSGSVAKFLNKNGIAVRSGFQCSALAHKHLKTTDTGTVRISPGIFNNQKEIERLIFLLKNAN